VWKKPRKAPVPKTPGPPPFEGVHIEYSAEVLSFDYLAYTEGSPEPNAPSLFRPHSDHNGEVIVTAGEQPREKQTERSLPHPPIQPEVCSSPIPDSVACPQLKVPFHLLDRVPNLRPSRWNLWGEQVFIVKILSPNEVCPKALLTLVNFLDPLQHERNVHGFCIEDS
jgi:hypothetical protein